jgi:thiamine biosynthesis lipoprotein ApbE
VTAWHQRGLVADALSTALYVMGPVEGLRWAEAEGLSACFLIAEDDTVRVSMTTSFAALVASPGPIAESAILSRLCPRNFCHHRL